MISTTTYFNNQVSPSRKVKSMAKEPPKNETLNTPSFPVMVHRMLTYVEKSDGNTLKGIVSWNDDGRTFCIHDQLKFEQQILPNFFVNQTRYRSFQRQLNFYCFQRVTKGQFEGSYGHPLCIRGNEKLAHDITRVRRAMKHRAERFSSSLYQSLQRSGGHIAQGTKLTASTISVSTLRSSTSSSTVDWSNDNVNFLQHGNGDDLFEPIDPSTLSHMERLHFKAETFFQCDEEDNE
jgi:hypothetical protein